MIEEAEPHLSSPSSATCSSLEPWEFSEHFRERCASCGAFMNTSHPGTAWAACGEFGEDTEYTCHRCTARPTFRLIAGNGTSDPRWCGYVNGGLHQPTGAEPVAAATPKGEPEQKDQS